jgi:hypothetical protein
LDPPFPQVNFGSLEIELARLADCDVPANLVDACAHQCQAT